MSRQSPQRHKAPHDVYARYLISHRRYPLFIPELKIQLPKDYQDHGLKIGDVGYVVPGQGCFEVLFNICLPPERDLRQAKRLPKNFYPITLDELDIASYTDVEDDGRASFSMGANSNGQGTHNGDLHIRSDYNFTLSSSEGALLILPQGADQHTLQCDRLFGEYAKKHAIEWYRFVEEDLRRTISPDSLYLITGFYKSRSWALASFQESEGSGETSVRFKVTPQEGDAIVRGYNWSTSRRLERRIGPKRYSGNANQAVYISGFKIAVRNEPAGRTKISVKVKGPSVESQHEDFTDTVDSEELDSSQGSESGESTRTKQGSSTNLGAQHTLRHVLLQCIPQVSQLFHPSDIINRILLRKEPSVTVAITHDSQWGTLLKSANGLLEPHDFADEHLVEEVLFEKYITASQDGTVFLERPKDARDTQSTDIDRYTVETAPTGAIRLFNQEFTDVDEQILLHYASFANDPQNCHHTCFWATAHGTCNMQVLGSGFAEHLRSCHGVAVPDGAALECRWYGCSTKVKKESLIRHIQEKHLEWKYVCPQCGERFTRNYTRQNHLKKHGAN